jgi:HAD superfamily hydrolase (TIGR01459 family)
VTYLSRISEIVSQFDLFAFDQYGTLHDGVAPYQGANTVLSQLRDAGKKIAVVSNSGRTGQYNRARLSALGFAVEGLAVITSGDCLQLWLKRNYPAGGMRTFVLGHSIEYLPGCEQTADITEAELIVFNGLPAGATEKDIVQHLDKSLSREIPLVCTNPDEVALEGTRSYRATGSFARDYQLKGGKVTFIGKPFPLIFEITLAGFPDVDVARAIYIGDSLDHDVRGAALTGIKSLWLLNGVHRDEFDGVTAETKWGMIRRLIADIDAQPDFVMEELAW